MTNVVSFAPSRPNGKTFLMNRIIPEGHKRRRWAVIIRESDGSEGYHLVRGEKDAIWLADVLRKAEAKRRQELAALEAHPIGEQLMKLTPEERDLFRRIFNAEARLRGVAE